MPITTDLNDSVATITIDRTERRNALNHATLDQVDAAVRHVVHDGARAIVLTGAGGHFCAGADLTELEDIAFTRHLAAVLGRLAAVPVTTVAAIDGSCMGLGMQLALACDLRVVAASARFAVPVAKLGLMVDHWTVRRLVRCWGEGAARQMILTAAVLDADDAWRLGFAQARGGLDTAQEIAASAVPLAPITQAAAKVGFDVEGKDQLASFEDLFRAAWASADLREGRAAFRERRTPRFHGR